MDVKRSNHIPVPGLKPQNSELRNATVAAPAPPVENLSAQSKNYAQLNGRRELSIEQQQTETMLQGLDEARRDVVSRHLPPDTRAFRLPVGAESTVSEALTREWPLMLGDEGFAEQDLAARAFFEEQKTALGQLQTILVPTGTASKTRITAYETVLEAERAADKKVKLELVVVKKGTVARDALTATSGAPFDVVIKATEANGSVRYIAVDDGGKATSGQGSVAVTPSDVVLSVDASDIGPNRRPRTAQTSISLSGAEEVQKSKRVSFYAAHGKVALAPFFAAYRQQHSEAQVYEDVALRNMIGSAIGAMPSDIPQETAPGRVSPKDETALKTGHFDFFHEAAAVRVIDEAIRKHGGADSKILPRAIVHVGERGEPAFHPLFEVTDKNNKVVFIDSQGRTYDNLEQWESNHVLPPGKIFLERERLEVIESHNTTLKTGVGKLGAAGVIVAGIVLGKGVLGSGTVARASQFLTATTSATIAALPLADKLVHREKTSAEDYLAPAAAGASSAVVLAKLAQLPGAASTTANRAAMVLGASSTSNMSHELSGEWKELSPEERWIQALNTAFFGALTGRRVLL